MEAFDVFVRNYDDGKPLITLTVNSNTTIGQLKRLFTEQYSEIFYPEKQLYRHVGVTLKRDNMTLKDYDVKPGDTLYVQDKGTQVSYRLAEILINIGPVITFALFHIYRSEIYTFLLFDRDPIPHHWHPKITQDIGFKMGFWHFAKRVFECIFVHFYSKPTKSLTKIVWEMGYTWLFFGVVIPFYLLHPDYNDFFFQRQFVIPQSYVEIIYYLLVVLFVFGEIMNAMCHIHLKSFRKGDHDYTRQIPIYHGYSFVSCANYFWEFLAWFAFTLITQTLMSVLYLTVTFFRMNYRAQRKHLRYIAEFKKDYPAEERRAFIPYLF